MSVFTNFQPSFYQISLHILYTGWSLFPLASLLCLLNLKRLESPRILVCFLSFPPLPLSHFILYVLLFRVIYYTTDLLASTTKNKIIILLTEKEKNQGRIKQGEKGIWWWCGVRASVILDMGEWCSYKSKIQTQKH